MSRRVPEVDISIKPLEWWPCDQCDGEGLEPAHQARANRAPDIIMKNLSDKLSKLAIKKMKEHANDR